LKLTGEDELCSFFEANSARQRGKRLFPLTQEEALGLRLMNDFTDAHSSGMRDHHISWANDSFFPQQTRPIRLLSTWTGPLYIRQALKTACRRGREFILGMLTLLSVDFVLFHQNNFSVAF